MRSISHTHICLSTVCLTVLIETEFTNGPEPQLHLAMPHSISSEVWVQSIKENLQFLQYKSGSVKKLGKRAQVETTKTLNLLWEKG